MTLKHDLLYLNTWVAQAGFVEMEKKRLSQGKTLRFKQCSTNIEAKLQAWRYASHSEKSWTLLIRWFYFWMNTGFAAELWQSASMMSQWHISCSQIPYFCKTFTIMKSLWSVYTLRGLLKMDAKSRNYRYSAAPPNAASVTWQKSVLANISSHPLPS